MRTHTARTWREYRDGLICLMTGVTREMENPHAMRDNKKKKTLRSTDTCFNKKNKSPPPERSDQINMPFFIDAHMRAAVE